MSISTANISTFGSVTLEDYHGSDLSVVNAARVSFAKRSDTLSEADKKLIAFLMRECHGTPFEHNSFTFNIKAPIFVAREWMRHRIGSFNEWSGRYSELECNFYIPERMRTQVGKPGAYTFEDIEGMVNNLAKDAMEASYDFAWSVYRYLLSMDVAKEVARMVLPLGIYTQFYWTVNARSLMNFLSLRNSPQAMKEIREYAQKVESLWAEKMPVTYQAFIDYGRIAP
ncbi:MAG: FAD-dependent thymidylate synthase [Nitrososphaerales archaeon]